jgi:hypothetical protein
MKKPKKKPLAKLKADLWRLFSIHLRVSYADKNGFSTCYTCGIKKHYRELQCGHGISGRGNAILFDKRICRPQCPQCNIFKHGNYQVFVPKLCKEIGVDLYQEIEKSSHKPVKLSRNWLESEIERLKNDRAESN